MTNRTGSAVVAPLQQYNTVTTSPWQEDEDSNPTSTLH
jgi:hypothetical protein